MPDRTPIIDVALLPGPVEAIPFDPFPAGAGGESVFLGRTRAETHPDHGSLRRLRYEAYEAMALRVLNDQADSAVSRFGCLAVRLHHALGPVEVGEASVLVQAACAHRADSFAACRFLIDALKQDAPIWKREEWADGSTWSEGAVVPAPESASAQERP